MTVTKTSTQKQAQEILRSPEIFPRVLNEVSKCGLVGEKRNALVVFLVAVSRLLGKPLNLFVKGASSSGKNFLVRSVLSLFPEDSVREITSTSEKGLYFFGEDLQHKVLYFQEENEVAGSVHQTRLLISEGKIIREVTERDGNTFKTVRHETKGPVACISTTTEDRLAADDESRHISAWIDESREQTDRILATPIDEIRGIPRQRGVWHAAQELIAERATLPIELPDWFRSPAILSSIDTNDVRIRRYFPAFAQACKVVSLVRSFQKQTHPRKLVVGFDDFAVTAIILDQIFAESLNRPNDEHLETKNIIARLSAAKDGRPVRASEIARDQDISPDRAYAKLRSALRAKTVVRANAPEKGNVKLFLPAPRPRFLPRPNEIFQMLKGMPQRTEIVHPLTGKRVIYKRSSGVR